MKNNFFTTFVCIFFGLLPFCVGAETPSLLNTKQEQQPTRILVNNRILAKINGKAISTFDVAKKMDMVFFRQYPQYITLVSARHQFYEVNWRYVLEDLINKELILADAKEHKIEVSSGDVRQEMEKSFGPNIIATLDKVGLSFEEASKIMQGDLIIQKLVNFRVHAKAIRAITPARVRQAYEEYIKNPENARLTQWSYQVVTIKDRTPQKTEETANKVYKQIIEEKVPLDKLVATLKDTKILGRKGKVTVSDTITSNEKELSDDYKVILSTMDPGMISQPSSHKSRTNNTIVYRIFNVTDKKPGGMPSFNEMENKLKEKLLNEVADQETDIYLKKLRARHRVRAEDLDTFIPSDYKPFILQYEKQ